MIFISEMRLLCLSCMFVICIPLSFLLSDSLIHFDEWGMLCVPCSFCFSSSLQMLPSFYVTTFSEKPVPCFPSWHSDWAVPVNGSLRLKKKKLEQRQRKWSGTGKLFAVHDSNHETDGGFGSKDGSLVLRVFVCQPLRKKTHFQCLTCRLLRWWKD